MSDWLCKSCYAMWHRSTRTGSPVVTTDKSSKKKKGKKIQKRKENGKRNFLRKVFSKKKLISKFLRSSLSSLW